MQYIVLLVFALQTTPELVERLVTRLVAKQRFPHVPLRQPFIFAAFHAELSAGGAATYLNFMGAEDADAVRGANPAATYARLCELKRRYDPDNVFRANHNIRPA